MLKEDPNLWQSLHQHLAQYFATHSSMLCVAIGTAVITLGKTLSDNKRDKFWGVLTESLLSAFIIGAVFKLLDEFGLSEDYIYAVGVFLSLFGVGGVRSMLVKYLKKHGYLDNE